LIGTEEGAKFKCPVCQARFRDSWTCLRCGADLAPLFLLIDQAYRLRQRARRALESGNLERAQEAAAEAQDICSTHNGRGLWLLSSWLLNETLPVRPSGFQATPISFTLRMSHMIQVRFTLKNATASEGDRILLTGNTAMLGKWAKPSTASDPIEERVASPSCAKWVVGVSVPAGKTIQFKFIKIAADGTVTWEKGPNHTYTVPMSGEGRVTVNWQC
jgi:Starch binding domain